MHIIFFNDIHEAHIQNWLLTFSGDRWCLCAKRWQQAHTVGKAPKVFLEATHSKATDINSLSVLSQYDESLP